MRRGEEGRGGERRREEEKDERCEQVREEERRGGDMGRSGEIRGDPGRSHTWPELERVRNS